MKWNVLESTIIEGDNPVHVNKLYWLVSWVARDRRNPVWICRHHPVRLNTPERPIVNQYREGKVKRTPRRGVKRPWNHALTSGRSIVYCVTACLLHNDPTSYSSLASLSTLGTKAQRKRVWIGRTASGGRRETRWSTHGQVEVWIVSRWRTEPIYVEKCSDDLWVGVKGQSNREIARTPRNAFRCSVE